MSRRRPLLLLLFIALAGLAWLPALVRGAEDVVDPGMAAEVPEAVHIDESPQQPDASHDGSPAGVELSPACQGTMEDLRWFDRAQGYWSERACVPAVWFDRFFGGGRAEDVATALVRVIPSVQYSDREFTETGIRMKAKVNLPAFERRLSVIVNDDDEADSGLLPGEVERPQQANAVGRSSSLAFRYLLQTHIDLDVGLRSELKLLTRIRYRHNWHHRPGLDTRFTQSAYFRDGEGFGESSLVEVERMLAEDMLLRWSTQATVSEAANGLELREGLQLYRQIDQDRAISWNIAASIKSDPAWKAETYATSIRYRQRAFRSWFFYEVEPFVDWIRADGFNTNPGIAFRIEFWFGDTGATRSAPAAVETLPATGTPSTTEAPVESSSDNPAAAPTNLTNDGPTDAP